MSLKKAFFALFTLIFLTLPITGRDKKLVKVAYYPQRGFQEYDEISHNYSGYAYEFLTAIKQYAGWDLEFVHTNNLEEALQAVSQGKADIASGVTREEIKEYKCLSSNRIMMNSGNIIVENENINNYAYEDFYNFSGLKIGYCKKIKSGKNLEEELEEYARRHDFTIHVQSFESEKDCDNALYNGTIDAALKKESTKTSFHKIADFSYDELYYAVNPEKTELLKELDFSMSSILRNSPDFYSMLKKRYYDENKESKISITDREKEVIKNVKNLKLGLLKDSLFSETFRELYDNVGTITDIDFDYIYFKSYKEMFEAFNDKQIDGIFEMPQDYCYASLRNAMLSAPIISHQIISVYHDISIKPTRTGYRPTCAVIQGTYQEYISKKIYSGRYSYLKCQSPAECMDAVLSGRAAVTLMNNFQTMIYHSDSRYAGLNYTFLPEFSYAICLALRDDLNPQIIEILSKGINKLGKNKINEIFNDKSISNLNITPSILFYKEPVASVFVIIFITTILITLLTSLYFTRQLKIKNAELIKAFSAKTEFLNKMSHDIRTPLNGILGMTYLAKEEDSKDKKQKYLENIDLSGRYLLNLVNDILDINKISNDNFTLKPESYPTKEFYAYISAIIQPLANKKNITFIIEPFESKDAFYVDSLHFNQLFINLLSNAVKYTNEGGAVSFYCRNVTCRGHIFNGDFVIQDNGIGMSKDFQKHMFESFTQEKQTTSEMGTGLGLSIVKQIVTLMRGTISVESETGQGSKFTVNLTIPMVPVERKTPKFVEKSDILKGLHVLICEDNAINAEIVSELLKKRGLIPEFAANGKEGLEAFKNSRPWHFFAIFMDIRMPVMDGFESAKAIRSLKRQDASLVPIIAITADAYATNEEKLIACGMNGHISKPVDPNELYKNLENFVRNERII